MRRIRAITALALLALTIGVPLQPAPAAAADSCAARNPFTSALRNELAQRFPGKRFSAEALDTRTGCRYTLNPQERITTASVLKVEVMAGVLLRAQREGRPITSGERSRIDPMITQSANPPTSELWSSLGGISGMEALDRQLSMTDTVHTSPWGLTSTSAHDQVELTRQVLLGQYGPFNAYSRGIAHHYMTHVVPSQRWGISAGVPKGWTVALKNGFAPSQCCGWRLNSTGFVYDPNGGGYALTVLTIGWSNESSGIVGNETVSRAVAEKLAQPVDVPLTCDWDGDGDDTPAVRRGNTFHLDNALNGGAASQSFSFGAASDVPVCGDWNGDGVDTIGVRRGQVWYLRNANSSGSPNRTFAFGAATDVAVVADWDGDDVDTVGVRRGATWYFRNANSQGGVARSFSFGSPGDTPVVGDWDGDGTDGIGVHRGSMWYLRPTASGGSPAATFGYGTTGDVPLAGDWDDDGDAGVGVRRDSTWLLRYAAGAGSANVSFTFGR